MRRRRTPPAVVELWIETLVVDASWPRRGRDELEAGLRGALEEELVRQAAVGRRHPGGVVSARLVDDLRLSCARATSPAPAGPGGWGDAAGRVIGADLGGRLWGPPAAARQSEGGS
jgi:hypothetical protein